MALIKVFSVDFYMSSPIQGLDVMYSEFRGSSVHQIPIIRIFGSSQTGCKTCLHIHGVFPYIYIPYEGLDNPNRTMYQIATKLDQAINTAIGQTSSTVQHVYKIVLVSGIPLYGYHSREHQFLKIYFYNPLFMKKACSLLQHGNVLGKIYQLHEAHIPFVLQFMIDYNLHGMNYISVSEVRYRINPDDLLSNVSPDLFLSPNVPKISTCQVEADALAEHIVNKLEVTAGQITKNPGIAALWNDEIQRRKNKNDSSQISQCLSQTRTNIPPTDSHNFFKEALRERLSVKISKGSEKDDTFVYPAETPKSNDILRASFIESHCTSDSSNASHSAEMNKTPETHLNDLNETSLDQTFHNADLNETDAKNLLEVLQDLGNDDDVEEGSILSQVSKPQEESDDEPDMTLPLAAVTTPIKDVCEEENLPKEESNASEPNNADPPVSSNNKGEKSDTQSSFDIRPSGSSCEEILKVKRQLVFEDIENSSNESEHKSENSSVCSDDKGITILENNVKPLISNHSSSQQNGHCIAKKQESYFERSFMNSGIYKKEMTHIVKGQLKSQKDGADNCISISPISNAVRKQEYKCDQANSSLSNKNNENVLNSIKSKNSIRNLQQQVDLSNKCIENSNSDKSSVSNSKRLILVPKFNPPSKETVRSSMSEYKIPMKRYQKPFYSDYTDLTREFQAGPVVLKIGTATSDLLEFNCCMVDNGLQELRKLNMRTTESNSNVKAMKLFFCKKGNCLMTTCKLPPSLKEVELWLKLKKTEVKTVTNQKKEKLKILLPCSPGGHSDSDSDNCISLSPFSSVSDGKTESLEIEGSILQTPKRSIEQTVQKEVRRKRIRKRKLQSEIDDDRIDVKKAFKTDGSDLRKSLLGSQLLNNINPQRKVNDSCRISGATLNNTQGFLLSLENLQKARTAVVENEYLTTVVMELHIQTRSDFKPDPQHDSIRAIFYSIFNDVPEGTLNIVNLTGMIAVDSSATESAGASQENYGAICDTRYVDTEINLINEFVQIIKKWDPDILAGYEVEKLSWGYLLERGCVLGINLQSLLARSQIRLNFMDDETHSGLKVTGRVLLDVWRLMRHEIALQSYTFENVMYHVLHVRIPLNSFKDLSFWWEHKSLVYRHKTVNFYLCRVTGIFKLFNQLDLIGRTCELARLFGIQFYEVLSRGSQFRVESMMLRLAKPLNFVAVSPSVQQRAKMRAPEFLPLILEPQSKLFTDPVIVLDFQSLYPSIIIAYNYCFSTCLGKVDRLGKSEPFEFGATYLKILPAKVKLLFRKNLLNFSPCGVAFVNHAVRQGILPRMLLEILDTRLMVKKSMKQNKDDKVLQRVLQSRQLGLKLIANVTYGYTAANFSGRMPAVELGDSVVSKGRETLLRAIKLIEDTPQWGAKVVYGDTDSVFVLVPGRSRQCAFKIGSEIAEAVTNANPSPVKLKLEKVYHPCILQTKKRYVGYMYESEDQVEPEFNAKGIETVRRDGCPAVSKMLQKSLKILFETYDVSLVRRYVERQFTKLMNGRISIQDLTFAKEYRGASSYRPGACVPVLELTRKWLAVDKRSEPKRGERVPYVIINGPPGLPLIKLVRCPREVLSNSSLAPNITYYIKRAIIPALNRCFTLIGADLNIWFNNMPRKQGSILSVTPDSTNKRGAIPYYFSTTNCIACNQQTQSGLCEDCISFPQHSVAVLMNKIRILERSYEEANQICRSCCGCVTNTSCISLDCPVLYHRTKASKDVQQITYLQQTMVTALNLDL